MSGHCTTIRSTRRRAAVIAAAVAAVTMVAPSAVNGASLADHAVDQRSAVPSDFVPLVDDTGVLSISVPGAWTDIDTTPGTNDDSTTMPWISASPDFIAFRDTYDVSGVLFLGVTYTADLQSWVDRFASPTGCGAASSQDYDDGAFQGVLSTSPSCGSSGQATVVVVAANAGADTSRTYVVVVQAATPDDVALVQPILASFNAIGVTSAPAVDTPQAEPGGTLPGVTPPVGLPLPDGSVLLPATASDTEGESPSGAPNPSDGGTFTPTNVMAEGAVQITDDTRTITVAVPPDWSDVMTTPVADASGTTIPQILASPDIAGFDPMNAAAPSFAMPGVRFRTGPTVADTAALLTEQAAGLACTPGPVQAYADPVFTGHIMQLTDCGGTTTRIYLIAATPADGSMTAFLLVQVTDSDNSDLQTVLSSFDVAPASTGSTDSTVTAPTVVTSVAPAPTVVAAPTTAATVTPPTVAVLAGPTTTGVYSPSVQYPADTQAVTDDTGLLVVGVPPSWTDRRTTPRTNADGSPQPYIAASPDLSTFLPDPANSPDPFSTPGVVYVALPYRADTAGLLAQITDGQACTPGAVQAYSDSAFTGHIQEFTACAGSQTRLFVIVANPVDQRFTAALTVQVTDDPAVLDTVLATFNYAAAAAVVPG